MVTVSKETIDKVRIKENLDDKKIRRAVEALKNWLVQQPHLPQDKDDGQLERLFLRCKQSVERSKVTLDMYYTLRTALPEVFSNRDPDSQWFKLVTSLRKGADTLKQFISPKVLPLEYGGEAGKLRDLWADWVKKLEANRDWFLEQERYKSDESKRPGKIIDTGELFGFQGSFRRLSLD
ncbi:hypothetical protein C0J52_01309 [Blattella germanica]|nr:hypothetical protein C0J52_01309 [Blattella germanica]